MSLIASKPLDFPPGTDWSYSNSGYVVLGRIIEVVSHQSYEQYIKTHFLGPLHMTRTTTVAEEAAVPGMAVGYRHIDGTIERAATINEAFAFSAGDLISTVDDLETWSAALAAGRVVSPADYALMTTEQKTTKGDATGYGFGLFLDAYDDEPRVGHTGGSLGFTTADEYYPKQDVRIIALTNDADGNPEAGEAIANAIFEDLYPEIARRATQPAAGEDALITAKVDKLFRAIQSGTVDPSTLTPHLAQKLTAGLTQHFSATFSPYGPPTAFVFRGRRVVNGLDWFDYAVRFGPGVSLRFGIAVDATGQIAALSFG